jgi:hypothetical protein
MLQLRTTVDNGSSDDCGVVTITLSTSFDCADIGDNIVTQTVTDDFGNTSTCTATVTVVDNLAPECLTQDITVQLDAMGMATISDDAVDAGSTDNCGGVTISLSQTSFDCADVGDVVVTQTVTDGSGNTSTCTATVTSRQYCPVCVLRISQYSSMQMEMRHR